MYTGDDFNYPELIATNAASDALLGIFDAIAPAAAAALSALDEEDRASLFDEIFEPTVALSRHIFRRPRASTRPASCFLAYLNGHQSHFRMVGGQESARSIVAPAPSCSDSPTGQACLVDPELASAADAAGAGACRR